MSTRFNPPPGWPLADSDGGLPPADWQPEAAAPPVPEGWPFYLDERGFATATPPGAWQPPPAPATRPAGGVAGSSTSAVPGAPRHRGQTRARRGRRWVLAVCLVAAVAVTVLVAIGS